MKQLRKSLLLFVATLILGVAEGWHWVSDSTDLSYNASSCDFEDDENFDILVHSPFINMLVAETDFSPDIPVRHIGWLIEDETSEGVICPISLPLRAPPVVG